MSEARGEVVDAVVGLARCNEPDEVVAETLDALAAGTVRPRRLVIVDNGDAPMSPALLDRARPVADGALWIRAPWPRLYCLSTPGEPAPPACNLGCAASWNLISGIAQDAPCVVLNADLAVSPDTLARVLAVPAPAVVLAYAFGCFRIDAEIRREVGAFDEAFYPVYYEDTDYRRRLRLAGVPIVEWPIAPAEVVRPGRERAPTGICHGKHDPDGYQGWRRDRLAWFHDRVAANRAYYVEKWGGPPDGETHDRPWGSEPIASYRRPGG